MTRFLDALSDGGAMPFDLDNRRSRDERERCLGYIADRLGESASLLRSAIDAAPICETDKAA